MTERIEREVTLDFLKVIATNIIVCHHFQQVLNVNYRYINFYGGRFSCAYFVELFFMISGICADKWIKPIAETISFQEFYYRRAKRLLPLVSLSVVVYSAEMILYYLLNGGWVYDRKFDFAGMFATCLGIQAGWATSNPGINNPMWYVSVLLLCYLLMYLVTFLAKRQAVSPYFFYIGIIFVGMGIATYGISRPFLNEYTARGYMSFFGGVVLEKSLKKINVQAMAVQAFAGILFACIVFLSSIGISSNMNFIVTFLLWPSVIVLCRSKWISKVVKGSFWSGYAEVSFSIYVWHAVILMGYKIIPMEYVRNIYSLRGMIFTLVIMQIIGILSYNLIEKPLDKLIMKCEARWRVE